MFDAFNGDFDHRPSTVKLEAIPATANSKTPVSGVKNNSKKVVDVNATILSFAVDDQSV